MRRRVSVEDARCSCWPDTRRTHLLDPSRQLVDPGLGGVCDVSAVLRRVSFDGAQMGAERMRDTLNEYFGRMINAVILTGGDVVKFAGDALMCVWRTEEDPDDSQERREAKLQAEVLTAVHTCLKMVMDLDEYKIPNVQQTLRLHIGASPGGGWGLGF